VTIDGIYHGPDDVLRVFTDVMKAELPRLLEAGIVIVIEGERDPVQLSTPESGQSLTLR